MVTKADLLYLIKLVIIALYCIYLGTDKYNSFLYYLDIQSQSTIRYEFQFPEPGTCNYKSFTSHLVLIRSPYLMSQKGTGTNSKAIKARRLLPHPTPRVAYIGNPARGRTAPATERTTVFAARALAAKIVKVSIRYLNIHRQSHSRIVFKLTPLGI